MSLIVFTPWLISTVRSQVTNKAGQILHNSSWIAEVDYNGEDREDNRDDAYDKNDYERMDPNKLSPQAESFHDNVAKVLVLSTRVWPDVITCKEKAAS